MFRKKLTVKIIKPQYIGICPIIDIGKIIDIKNDKRIIENLSLSKKLLIVHPYVLRTLSPYCKVVHP